MPLNQRIVIVGVAALLMLSIFELVRLRRLREEYAWLWLLAGGLVMAAAFVPMKGLTALANVMGSQNPPAAVFFLGFCATTFLCLQFSVRLSRMTEQIKNLGQKVSLLEAALDEARAPDASDEAASPPPAEKATSQ
ncbi:MAG TPA: hypothetical protein DEA08_21545 [Planctomycetes bacterium]|nr:hypothetical protein [Planctomycetota bacterium]